MMTAWDRYGPLRQDKDCDAPMPKGPPDLLAYMLLSRKVSALMFESGMRERNWTRYRVASTVLAEIQSGETWTDRRRREVCGCDRGDFRRRLGGLYEAALALASANSPQGVGGTSQSIERRDANWPGMASETDDEADRMAA